MNFCYMCVYAVLVNPKLLYCTAKKRYFNHYHNACENFEKVKG